MGNLRTEKRKRNRQRLQAKRDPMLPLAKLEKGDPNWQCKCTNCGETPTVHPTKLCGPCCFGEAETAGGNW